MVSRLRLMKMKRLTRLTRCGYVPSPTLPTSSNKEFYKHVAHDFEDPLAWTPCPRRGQAGIHAVALYPGPVRRSICGTAMPGTVSSSTCAAFSSWTMPEQLMPALHAFRARGGSIQPIYRSMSRVKSLQQSKDIDGIRSGCTRKVLGHAGRHGRERQGKLHQILGSFRRRAQGRPLARIMPTRKRLPA